MIELLNKRKLQLQALYKKCPDIQIVYRLREIELMTKRYKKLLEIEVDASGVRPELEDLAKDLNG